MLDSLLSNHNKNIAYLCSNKSKNSRKSFIVSYLSLNRKRGKILNPIFTLESLINRVSNNEKDQKDLNQKMQIIQMLNLDYHLQEKSDFFCY